MKREVAAGPEHPAPWREHEFQVRRVAQSGRRDPHASRRSGSTSAHPAATMKLDLVTPRWVSARRFVAIRCEKQVAMICSYDRVLDSRGRKLANSAREVVNDSVHYLSSLVGESSLASVVDLLRSDDNDLSTFQLPRELRRRKA